MSQTYPPVDAERVEDRWPEADQPLRRPRDNRSGRRKATTGLVPGVSRRNLLAGLVTAAAVGGGGAGALLLSGPEGATTALTTANRAGAAATTDTARPATSVTKKKAAFALSKNLDPALLISRATYGRTAALDNDIDKHGTTAWFTAQLAPSKLKDTAGDSIARRFPHLGWSVPTAHSKLKQGDWALMYDTQALHLGRAIWSTRQLNEVMVDFWANHLNVPCPNGDVWDTRHRYQIDVIRKHALGSFEDMLFASGTHSSMLVYLGANASTGADPNENYARELLELHTVGVNGGYTERDVKKAALLLTGWSVENGKARFAPERHHVGALKVMGWSTKNASASKGAAAQKSYLKYLAHHPSTARNIATKLARRFVSDAPPKALIDRLAATYKKNRTEIVPVLKELFSSPEFADSSGEKIRRPLEHVIATARVIGVKPGKGSTDTKGLGDLNWMLNDMGHQPLARFTPDGYPDVAAAWQSPAAALARFNATATMVHGWWPNALVLPGPKGLLSNPPRTRTGMIDAVGRKVWGRKPTASEAQAARTLLAGTKLPSSFGSGSWEQQETAALTATLFLNAPAHELR